jgi:U2 small nuclear ribonucleoprotein A'
MVAENVPGLLNLILTNNRLANLGELEHLIGLTKLVHLSLLDNPVVLRPHYRAYVIHKIPSLKTLDYAKITRTEREESAKFFKTQAGQVFLTGVLEDKHTPASSSSSSTKPPLTLPDRTHAAPVLVLTDAQKVQVRAAIEAATTREEIEVIEKHLKAGSLAFLSSTSTIKLGVHVLGATNGIPSSEEMVVESGEKEDTIVVSETGEEETKGMFLSCPFQSFLL